MNALNVFHDGISSRHKLFICRCLKVFDLPVIWIPLSSALWPWLSQNKSASSPNKMWFDVKVDICCNIPAQAYLDLGIPTHPPLVHNLEWAAPPQWLHPLERCTGGSFPPLCPVLNAHTKCTAVILCFFFEYRVQMHVVAFLPLLIPSYSFINLPIQKKVISLYLYLYCYSDNKRLLIQVIKLLNHRHREGLFFPLFL